MPLAPLISALIGGAVSGAVDAPPPVPVVSAAGMLRAIPAEAKVGEMTPPWQGTVRIGDQTLLLAPGAQIRNEANMIVLPTAIQQSLLVRYQTDMQGAVSRIWILTAAEAAVAQR